MNSGYWWKYGSEDNRVVPILADVVYRWNLGQIEKWSIFLEGRGGYLLSVKSDREYAHNKNYEFGDHIYFDVQPGVYYRIRRNIDLKLAVGFGYSKPTENETKNQRAEDQKLLFAKVGMNFRGKPTTASRAELLEEAARLLAEAEAKKAAEAAAEAARTAATNLVFFYSIRETSFDTEDDAKLQDLVKYVNSNAVKMIYIKGYADKGTGNPYVNRKYAKQRAENVKKALVSKYGIDSKMIECLSYGDTVQPYTENDKNRCATIFVEFE